MTIFKKVIYIFFQFFPVRRSLAFHLRSVYSVATKSNGFLHTKITKFPISKRYAASDYIGVETKSRIYDFINRFQIMNPLNKSVSLYE